MYFGLGAHGIPWGGPLESHGRGPWDPIGPWGPGPLGTHWPLGAHWPLGTQALGDPNHGLVTTGLVV